MLGRALSALGRVAFRPETLPPGLVGGLALAPPVLAGLLFFRLPALAALTVALAIGAIFALLTRARARQAHASPILAAVVAVALAGPRASILWSCGIALAAAAGEALRARLVPAARLHTGLLTYAALLLAGAQLALYTRPGEWRPAPEPIRLWLGFPGLGGAPIDPIRLYVGNIAGPLFATSLLAVVVGAAWLWYARRLSLLVVGGVLVGAAIPISVMRWDPGFQLDSGPLWFAAALVLADRRYLPKPGAVRLLLGIAAGASAVAVRARGLGIEAGLVAVAAVQLAVALVEAGSWLTVHRRQVWAAIRGIDLHRFPPRLTRRYRPSGL